MTETNEWDKFKENVNIFMNVKNKTNEHVRDIYEDLSERLSKIEAKIDRLIWGLLGISVLILTTLLKRI